MDERRARERQRAARQRMRQKMRKKRRKQMIRRYIRMGIYSVGLIAAVIILVKAIIVPIIKHFDKEETIATVEVQASDPYAAVRQPLKGINDSAKIGQRVPGWHEDETGRWYQNADGTYYAGGMQKIDGVRYSFDKDGYIQKGWVTVGVNEYYFNEDGSFNPDKKRPLLALTFDDGPGQYTDQLLDCLEENNAHATFFMLGEHVAGYEATINRMKEIGCEIGSHSWNHPQLTNQSLDEVAKQFADTDNALIEACGQAATVARAPYGSWNQDIIDTVGKPFFMWSLDSLDWEYRDVQMDINEVMNGNLSDGSVILMHDIHPESVEAAIQFIPKLIEQGYKFVTVSEMAQAKNVELQNASYSDFWESSLENGIVAGYNPNIEEDVIGEMSQEQLTSEGESQESEEITDGESTQEEDYNDGETESSEESYTDGEDAYSDGNEE